MVKNILILIVLASTFASTAQEIKAPVARYTFNNNKGKDDISNNNARLYNVLPAEDRFGNDGFACNLLGNFDSYINLGTSDTLKPRAGSISLWARVDLHASQGCGLNATPFIYTRSHAGEDFNEACGIGYNFDLKTIGISSASSEAEQVFVHSRPIELRRWYHTVTTWDDAYLCLYVNGILVRKAVKGFETKFLKGDSLIAGGRNEKKNKRFLFGCIDDIEIYDRVLSPSEVLALYNAPDPNRRHIVLKWVFVAIGLVISIVLLLWLIKRYIRRAIYKEKEKYRLQNQWIEQENKILAVQMNPHFIFNSLNTIQQFIFVNDNEKAQLYLSKFSRLIRKFLENNTKDYISLTEEIELCEKYLEIESLRFNNVFSYTIAVKNPIDVSAIKIPHFLIQPFIENAIWHGLLPKKGDKFLSISFELINEKILSCTIEDNGVGRAKAGQVEPIEKKKSLAINFIKQRLLLYSKLEKTEYKVQITDKLSTQGSAEGTRVVLTLPIIYN
ncbi:MAG TPA: histidine kinase [Bacteroidia bacterium]|nr:histidine kinase [Bacteroidia bacterium]